MLLTLLFMPINDITTTLQPPPVFVNIAQLEAHKGQDLSYPEHFKKRLLELYPDLKPITSNKVVADMFKEVERHARAQEGWVIISSDLKSFRIEAVATTPLMRFRDDIVIEVRPEPSGSSVHMRSRSRVGRSDLGANAKRIQNFLKGLAP